MTLRSTPVRLAALVAAIACLCAVALQQPPSALARSVSVDIAGRARVVPGNGTALKQVGSFTGRPLGQGTLRLTTRLGQGKGAVFTFSMQTPRGTVSGSGTITLKLGKKLVSYAGTANITSGTGAFRSYRARNLHVTGSGGLTDKSYPIHLTGSLTT
jgi:hypothetical protein